MPHSLIPLNDSLPGASLLNFRDKRHLRVCFGVTVRFCWAGDFWMLRTEWGLSAYPYPTPTPKFPQDFSSGTAGTGHREWGRGENSVGCRKDLLMSTC